ncbi:hypothetical protein [Massilia antarctica]|uniref:hypothetical protein n=1 Tax=Massilia antarctica TaxID=2765360 RepID=UPI002271B449|nr:hypothetical protein [Massilia sp. H27-R4]MCY0916434.1 hypothetical protein [Massilia sp. H27-R4]
MTTQKKYERIGKFIYSACRYGADVSDVYNWMANDVGVARPDTGDEFALRELCTAFLAKHISDDELNANYERFVEAIKIVVRKPASTCTTALVR